MVGLPSDTPLIVALFRVTEATTGCIWPFAEKVKSVPTFCQAVAPPVALASVW